MYKIFFLVLLITHCIIASKSVLSREDYQNPHQLPEDDEGDQETPSQPHPHSTHINLDSVYTRKNSHKKAATALTVTKSQKNMAPYSLSHAYVKRFVNLILNSLHLDKRAKLPLYSGVVNIKLTEENYMFLKDFAGSLSEENIDNLKKVDSIMTQAFDKSFYERSANWVSSIADQIYIMMFNKFTAVLLCAVFVLFFVYRLLIRENVSAWGIFKCSVFLLYVSDFATTYLHLCEVEEGMKYVEIMAAGKVPPECDPSKMSYINYFLYLFKGENPCTKYYKAIYENVFYIVVPIKVIKLQITNLSGLMKVIGGGIGDFYGEMFVRLPWGVNIILWPIVLIFILLLILITYSSFLGGTLKLTSPYFQLEFGGDRPNGNSGNTDTISGNNLSSISPPHRELIEDVQEKSETSKGRKRRSKEKNKKIQDDKEESDGKEPKQSKSSLNAQDENKT